MQKLLLLVVVALFASSVYAHDVEIDGIYYNLNETNRTASVTFLGSFPGYYTGRYTGDVVIPEYIECLRNYYNITYHVTSIGASAFKECSRLTSVSIPSSVTNVGNFAFSECTGLTAINVSSDNPAYCSIDGILYSKDKTVLIGCPGGKTGAVNIPSSVTSIERYAFDSCTGLISVSIPSSVTSIEGFLFEGCSRLTAINVSSENPAYCSVDGILYNKDKTTLIRCPRGITGSVNIPSSVTSIEYYAFDGCTDLISVNIPSSVTSIGDRAFRGCIGLTSITLPSSVTSIGAFAFDGCTLKPLCLFCKLSSYEYIFNQLYASSMICAYSSEKERVKKYWSGQIVDIDYSFSIDETYLKGVEFKVAANEYLPILQSVKLGDIGVALNENGIYMIAGLSPDTSYDIVATFKAVNGETIAVTKKVKTLEPDLYIDSGSSKQTTLAISISASSDKTCSKADKKGFIFNNKEYDCTNGKVVLTGLIPNTTYIIYPFAEYGATRISEQGGFSVKTASLKPVITAQNVSPTSISVKGSYTEDDAHVSEAGFSEQNAGNTLTMTGLKPNTSYTLNYYVKTKEGSNETVSKTFTTPALELTTLQPRCVSNTCAVVAAETNISEEEPNVGFQWKKYDAPASLKPSEGYAAIYNGQIEGYIKNLQPTSYYNVRAFYKSNDGIYYYGDWVTFDPSDFSYFEPTVHTYEATDVTARSAKVKGYVLAGTDNIIEQGFEYWSAGALQSKAMRVPAAVANDVTTVLSTGQVMTATLTNLQPNTTYHFRSFVKTASGTTYGEEQILTTDYDTTGIGSVEETASEPVVVGYYDLNGRRLDGIGKGITILRYSDGSTRKVVRR